jgi:diaminohydroxyphosphoribosylaminopyrimidine deaminase/5-amino-6-(5-phosphoribosylamino)uracil reductase
MNAKATDPGVDRARALLDGDPAAEQLLGLYAPLLSGERGDALIVGHVGQSLDGQIATRTGASRYITGGENLVHIHRLRALVDAVVVGASTVEFDDPQLTVRLVSGNSPVRVVIDPNLRLPHERRIFTDGAVRTLVVCAEDVPTNGKKHPAELVRVARSGNRLSPAAIAEALRRRGLARLLVEGGGVTVSRFIEARALHHLHVTIGPLLVGSGRPGIVLPGIDRVDEALRPVTRRFDLGADVLFDCRLAASI